MVAAQTAEKHGDEWGLTWYLQWGIYTFLKKLGFTPCKVAQPLQDIDLPEKEIQKD